MSRLQKNLGEILNEKTTKIIPENIKSGVTIFGITGTLEEGVDTTVTNTGVIIDDVTITGTNPFTLNSTTGYYEYSAEGNSVLTIKFTKVTVGSITLNYKGRKLSGADAGNIITLDGVEQSSLVVSSDFIDYTLNNLSVGSHTLTVNIYSDNSTTSLFIKLLSGVPISNDKVIKGYIGFVNGTKVVGTKEDIDTSDATATADDILEGKTAYVNGQKIIGTRVETEIS